MAESEALHIQVFQSSEVIIFRLKGELDLATAPHLRNELAKRTKPGVSRIALELAELTFIDSVGLSILVAEHKRMEDLGGLLVLQNPSPGASKLFEISGLSTYLHVESVDDPSS
jgi:anti-sigma B factor antagonist